MREGKAKEILESAAPQREYDQRSKITLRTVLLSQKAARIKNDRSRLVGCHAKAV
jgi:hypothetical protein